MINSHYFRDKVVERQVKESIIAVPESQKSLIWQALVLLAKELGCRFIIKNGVLYLQKR